MLLQALLVLLTSGTRFTFDFVGEGPEAPRILRFLEQHSIPFVAHGSVPSVRVFELMSAASVVAVPSLMWEGWGYVVNEALAARVPVAVSDIVGAAEVVVPGVTGVVFKAGDLEGLVQALRQCLHMARTADPSQREAMLRVAEAIEPQSLAAYMIETMNALRFGKSVPIAPWHAVISELGGNGSLDWWRHAGQGGPAPASPFIPKRRLRHI
jgi:glycogen(starch) synthase